MLGHHALGERVVAIHRLAPVLDPRREQIQRGDVGPRSAGEDRDKPEVVDVLVGDDDQPEILDAAPVGGEGALERVQRGAGVRAAVDERQRVVVDEVGVDAADPERCRDRQAVDAGVGGAGERRGRRGGRRLGHERMISSTSSRRRSMSSAETSDSRQRRMSGSVTVGGGGGGGAPEAWHNVAAGTDTHDPCAAPSVTGVFCSENFHNEGTFYRWRNYGGAFSPVAYYMDQGGVVHLKGLAQSTKPPDVSEDPTEHPIFRLPPAYRPATRRVFPSVGGTWFHSIEIAPGRIDVQSNGLVTLVQSCGKNEVGALDPCSAPGNDITLDGITFRPAG